MEISFGKKEWKIGFNINKTRKDKRMLDWKNWEYVDSCIENKNEKVLTAEEAIKEFEKEYEKSRDDDEYVRGDTLTIIKRMKDKNEKIYKVLGKSLCVKAIKGLIMIEVFDDHDSIEYYHYINPNAPFGSLNFPNEIAYHDHHGLPLFFFTKDKEIAYRAIRNFINNKGDTNEVREIYKLETWDDYYEDEDIPFDVLEVLESIKNNNEIDKNYLTWCLIERVDKNEIIREVVYEKIEKYLKENDINKLRFLDGENLNNVEILNYLKEYLITENYMNPKERLKRKKKVESFEENGVEWKDKEKFLEKNETPKSEEIFLKKPKKPIEQTYDSIRDWLLPLLRKDDKIIFPKEEFLERIKLFDEAEKLRTFNVIKSAVEHDNYCVKFEEDKTIRGYEVIKAFGEMLGIAVEEEVVENVEETEVEEEKKLTPQQLRKKYFLKRMKGEDK